MRRPWTEDGLSAFLLGQSRFVNIFNDIISKWHRLSKKMSKGLR